MSLCCGHWYFISLPLLDHTKDTLNSFYFLVMNLMPLGGHKTVLQGVEMITTEACRQNIVSSYKTLPEIPLLLQLHGLLPLFSERKNNTELISATGQRTWLTNLLRFTIY